LERLSAYAPAGNRVGLCMPLKAIQGASEKLYLDEELFSIHEWARLLHTDEYVLAHAASSSGAVVIKIAVEKPRPMWKRFLFVYEFPRLIAGLANRRNEQLGGYFHEWARQAAMTPEGILVTVPQGPTLLYTVPLVKKSM
jgi:hypothetical protein